jgi:hypothetical protein
VCNLPNKSKLHIVQKYMDVPYIFMSKKSESNQILWRLFCASKTIEIYIKAELLPLKQNIQNNFESTFKSFKPIFFSF